MKSRRYRLPAAAAMAVCLLGFAVLSAAASRDDDRSLALSGMASLSAAAQKLPGVSDALARARRALQRAADARAAGDAEHGAMLESLSREWADTARDLVRVAEVETRAHAAELRASNEEAKAVRARALLEETVARRGRAKAKLDELEKPTPGAPAPRGKPEPAAARGDAGVAP